VRQPPNWSSPAVPDGSSTCAASLVLGCGPSRPGEPAVHTGGHTPDAGQCSAARASRCGCEQARRTDPARRARHLPARRLLAFRLARPGRARWRCLHPGSAGCRRPLSSPRCCCEARGSSTQRFRSPPAQTAPPAMRLAACAGCFAAPSPATLQHLRLRWSQREVTLDACSLNSDSLACKKTHIL